MVKNHLLLKKQHNLELKMVTLVLFSISCVGIFVGMFLTAIANVKKHEMESMLPYVLINGVIFFFFLFKKVSPK